MSKDVRIQSQKNGGKTILEVHSANDSKANGGGHPTVEGSRRCKLGNSWRSNQFNQWHMYQDTTHMALTQNPPISYPKKMRKKALRTCTSYNWVRTDLPVHGWCSPRYVLVYPLGNRQKAIEAMAILCSLVYPWKMVMFHSYVSLPEGNPVHGIINQQGLI